MKHKILMAVTLVFFSACMKIKKKEDNSPVPTAQTQELKMDSHGADINTRTEFEYKYEVSETSDFHKVHFYAPAGWDPKLIVRKSNGTEKSEDVAIFNEQGEWIDLLVPGEKVSYQFFATGGKDEKPLTEVEVLPVLDLTAFDEDVDLFQKYQLTSKTKVIQIRNLEIHSQKHLFIENFSGTIVVENLKTENGFIQTFPSDSSATDDKNGVDGGQVSLIIKNGTGQLNLVMKGQNGGNGSPAKDPDVSLNGARGARAEVAQFAATGDMGPYGMSQGYRCIKNPGESNYGINGLRGYPGKIGKSGGNSGSIAIFSSNPNLDITFNSFPGSGGKLSQGGVGGEGGEPGDIADGAQEDLDLFLIKLGAPLNPVTKKLVIEGFVTQTCPASVKKGRGDHGPDGFPGAKNGEPGIVQSSYINSQKIQQ